MSEKPLPHPPKAPRHWPSWLAVGFLWVLGKLPRGLGLAITRPLGPLMHALMGRRRAVAARNIERCFPELGEEEVARLVRRSFRSLARAVTEMAWAWSGPDRLIARLGEVRGLEHLERARAAGKGVLMVTHHSTCLEIGARLVIFEHQGVSGVYRPLKNPVMEWYQTRGRTRYADAMVSKRDARGAVRVLRAGKVLWYAPDQDFGPEQSVFAPFFGIETATLLATHRLPKMTGCAVVPMFPRWDAEAGRYVVEILPALEDFPSEDPVADLTRVNALMEAQVRKAPEQYWWIHRRFKTRPEGEPPFYR